MVVDFFKRLVTLAVLQIHKNLIQQLLNLRGDLQLGAGHFDILHDARRFLSESEKKNPA